MHLGPIQIAPALPYQKINLMYGTWKISINGGDNYDLYGN